MTQRRLFVLASLVIWIIALVLTVTLALERFTAPSWGNPVGDQFSVEIAGDSRVGQAFTAPLPGLSSIDVALVRGEANQANRITFHLKNDPLSAQDVWVGELDAGEIRNNTPYIFAFTPIRDSQSQSFYFYLESSDSQPEEAIAARYSEQMSLPGASAYVNDEPVPGNLQFQTHYELRTWEKIDLVLTKMATGKPYFMGSKWFYIGLAAAYALILSILILLIATSVIKNQQEES